MQLKPYILVVDDDERLRDLLKRYLEKQGYGISVCHDGVEALDVLAHITFDLIVLDVMMPHKNGFEVLKEIRARHDQSPVLMLTAKSELNDRIDGLESGADDYLSKPFEPKELDLRIKAILKRTQKSGSEKEKKIGPYTFDTARGQLHSGNHIIDLTDVEATLLRVFLDHPGEILSRLDLARLTGQDPDNRTLDVQVTRLRRKIENDSKTPIYLQTVRGKGYVLRPD